MSTTSSTFDPSGSLHTTVEATPQQLDTGYDALAQYVRRYRPKAAVQAQALAGPALAQLQPHEQPMYRPDAGPQEPTGRSVRVIGSDGKTLGIGWAQKGSLAYEKGYDVGIG